MRWREQRTTNKEQKKTHTAQKTPFFINNLNFTKMKKRIITTVVAAIFMAAVSNAAVWRVSNITGADAHFTTIQAANNSTMVLPGDTLYIEPSPTTYSNATINKPLTIIGSGYFVTENPETQAIPHTTRISGITFTTGSSGSVIMGCTFTQPGTNSININASNIRVERNNITGNSYISINSNVSNVLILRNFLSNGWISVSGDVHNLLISGNFIDRGSATSPAISMQSTTTAVIEHNVILGAVTLHNAEFHNNILREGVFTPNNTIYTHNIAHDNQFGNQNGNQQYVNMANVFLGTGSTDGQWQLKPGSPAIGAGTGGQDCGMYAGTNSYILSGMPPIPSIYRYMHVYDGPGQQIEVNFDVKSHN